MHKFESDQYYETDFLVGENSLSEIIAKHANCKSAILELGNDSWIVVDTSLKNVDKKELNEVLKGIYHSEEEIGFAPWELEYYMKKMCLDGAIPEGKYVIKHWW